MRQTSSNHIIAEIAKCGEMSLKWFHCTKPSLRTSVEEKECVLGVNAPVVEVHRSFSNLIEASRTTSLQRQLGVETSLLEFGVVRLYQIFSNYIPLGVAKTTK